MARDGLVLKGTGGLVERNQFEGLGVSAILSDNGGTGTPGNLIKNASLNVPYRGVKGEVYEGGIRVPFVAQWKGCLPAGQTYAHPITALDLLPTALSAAGIPPLAGVVLDGVNLLPFLEGKAAGAPHGPLYWRWQNRRAVQDAGWKWIRNGEEPPELYHLGSDLFEAANLAAREPARTQRLGESWATWDAGNPPLDPAHRGSVRNK